MIAVTAIGVGLSSHAEYSLRYQTTPPASAPIGLLLLRCAVGAAVHRAPLHIEFVE